MTLSRFVIRSGTASIELAGDVTDAPGSPEVHLTGTVSPMPVDMLKSFWPKFLAGDARKWVLQNVRGGEVLGGKVAVSLEPGELARMQAGAELAPEAVNVELDLANMSLTYVEKLPPILTGSAKMRVSGITFWVDIPEAKIALPSGQEIALSEGRFLIPDLRPEPQQGQITFKAAGATATVLQLLDHEPLGYMQAVGMKPEAFGGTATGNFVLDMPMREDLKFKDIKLRGEARLDQAIASNVVGNISVEGGALDVNVTEQALDARGQILIKGVPAELAWQRIFHEPDDRQPPIRISATLDEPAREALGLKISHLLKGPLPVTLSVARNAAGAQSLSMQADLTPAQLVFGNMGWTKPQGRSASLQFDIVQYEDGSTDLKNFKILGDEIAIDGSISLDPEQHLKSFYFSDFSFDRLTHVEINAAVRDGNVLEVDAHGPSYNGKQFFQSLFSAGQIAEDADPRDPFSVDLTARFGTVVGFYNSTVTDVQATLKKRSGRLVELNATGKLNGRSPLAVKLDGTNGARIIRAESHDAGAAFRLIGFYPKVDGGEASLEVNLDASDAGMKSGTLWARNFCRARRFRGERRAVRSAIPGGLGRRAQEASPAEPHRLQSAPRAVLCRQWTVSVERRVCKRAGARRYHARPRRLQNEDGQSRGDLCAPLWFELGAWRDPDPWRHLRRPRGGRRGWHHLRHPRSTRRPECARQPDLGRCARHLPPDLRVQRRGTERCLDDDGATLGLHRPSLVSLDGANQHVALLAERKLDHALRREVGERQQALLVGDRLVVHL